MGLIDVLTLIVAELALINLALKVGQACHKPEDPLFKMS